MEHLTATLVELDDVAWHQPSRLPGWSRLTILCHLRYGHAALRRMTLDTSAGRATSYYPQGRARQRACTLQPRPGERSVDVVADWRSTGADLDAVWSTLDDAQWSIEVVEPADNPDLGTVPLGRVALARLAWLEKRRTNQRGFERSICGSWLLSATDGPQWWVAVDDERVESRPATKDDDVPAGARP
jgi:hypothetical protein